MEARGITLEDLDLAINRINRKYEDNIKLNNYRRLGKARIRFTVKCKSSRGPGARRYRCYNGAYDLAKGYKLRRGIHACWHVHGDLFDELLRINPEAVIRTGFGKITKGGGNWQDYDIGSMLEPFYYSESCNCEEEE